MSNHKIVQRTYPTCCTSLYCGRIDCSGCSYLPRLESYRAYAKQVEAEHAAALATLRTEVK
jgi:hypothetical protein